MERDELELVEFESTGDEESDNGAAIIFMLCYVNKCARGNTGFMSVVLSTLTVLVATIDALWEGMGDVGSARYEPALLPPCPTIRA